ncbi:MAG: alpha/beta hydrolase, partial [Pseudomonadales bacterium]
YPEDGVKGTIFIQHGYYDHVGLFKHIIAYCLAKNYAVIAYDLPGHGVSSGPPASIDSFQVYQNVFNQCLQLAMSHCPKPWSVIAQSTGAAIVMDYCLATEENDRQVVFENVILLAPLVRPVTWARSVFFYHCVRHFVKKIKRGYAVNSHDLAFLHFVKEKDLLQHSFMPLQWVGALKDWLQDFEQKASCSVSPIVIQGNEDGTVDWQYNMAIIRKKFHQPAIHIVQGARHQLANESSAIRAEIFSIIDGVI